MDNLDNPELLKLLIRKIDENTDLTRKHGDQIKELSDTVHFVKREIVGDLAVGFDGMAITQKKQDKRIGKLELIVTVASALIGLLYSAVNFGPKVMLFLSTLTKLGGK